MIQMLFLLLLDMLMALMEVGGLSNIFLLVWDAYPCC